MNSPSSGPPATGHGLAVVFQEMKVMSSGLDGYERFIKDKIARLKCVASIETNFVMSTIKERRT